MTMKTKTLTITTHDFINTPDGGYFKRSTREEEFPNEEDRDDDLCIVCGFKPYPECKEWCQNEQWKRERAAKKKNEE